MDDIRFFQVKKIYGNGVVAVDEFSLHVPAPTLVVLVGPSGCGKTTVLRLIAGLEKPSSGRIMMGETRLDVLAPQDRDVAMVFQSYALYPHMTVRENLTFGLKVRKVGREVIERGLQQVAATLEIAQLLDRKPAELSGGQRQRVALGRAIIREPKVFLFDEPLSNLDARLRDEMRYAIKRLYTRLRTTTVYVTHDQVEAMTIGEMLVVMKDGRIHQIGAPAECYRRPQDTFVAAFLGSPPMNLLSGTFESAERAVVLRDGIRVPIPESIARGLDRSGEREVVLGFRPEDVSSADGDAYADRGGIRLRGRLTLFETLGHEMLSHVEVAGGDVICRGKERPASGGEEAVLTVDEGALHFFSGSSGRRIETARPGR